MNTKQAHWQKIYETRTASEFSWTQDVPFISLSLIDELQLPKDAAIIDVGGGESRLVDHLLERGFENITVLDISSAAIEKSRQRLGSKKNRVRWISCDVLEFSPDEKFDLWHDRAVFHFFTAPAEIDQYVQLARQFVKKNLVIGTFSDKGPLKCSGLEVSRYSTQQLENVFSDGFKKIGCRNEEHQTPFGTLQSFSFCSFVRH